jgi:hypothetical protein
MVFRENMSAAAAEERFVGGVVDLKLQTQEHQTFLDVSGLVPFFRSCLLPMCFPMNYGNASLLFRDHNFGSGFVTQSYLIKGLFAWPSVMFIGLS